MQLSIAKTAIYFIKNKKIDFKWWIVNIPRKSNTKQEVKIMGNCLSGLATRQFAESFIDVIQTKGLKQFEPEGFNFDDWNANHTFGDKYTRNTHFKTLLNHLSTKFKAGFKAAKYSPGRANGNLEDLIYKYLTHHVMQKLLNPEAEIKVAYTGLELANKKYAIPKYDETKIAAFQAKWTLLASGTQISLDTTDDDEKALLSSKLASVVIQVIKSVDVVQFVAGAIQKFVSLENTAALKKQGLFAQAKDGDQLLAGREKYSDFQQAKDAKAVIKSDLHDGAKHLRENLADLSQAEKEELTDGLSL